jgi:Fanconi anemia group M protein
MDIVIFADTREKDIIELLKKHDCHVVEKMLEVADFVVYEDIGVERKRAEDFVQSMIDGRLFEQMENLTDSFERPLLIIEGSNLYDRDVHENAIRGALASVALDYGVPMIWTRDKQDTAALLYRIAKREQSAKEKIFSVKGRRKPLEGRSLQEYIVSSLPGIGPMTAKNLLARFGSVEKIFAADEKALMDVDKIGKKKAKLIRETVSKAYEDK